MFNPPEELHTRFEEVLVEVKSRLGQEHGMIINGEERFASEKFEDRSPSNTDQVLGISCLERASLAGTGSSAAQSC
jgi:1-pyrroline-5-carboxylate dehydrogenase